MRSLVRRQQPAELERRRAYIRGYSFPPALRQQINEHHAPALTGPQLSTVFEGLRAWFVACLVAEGKTLGMPSNAVDVGWHEFILMTRAYHAFCDEAFGYYLHHSPESTMRGSMDDALRRTAVIATRYPESLIAGVPVLFAVDSELRLDDGMHWSREDVEGLKQSGGGGAGGGGGCGSGDGGGGCGGGGCGGG